MKTKTEKPVTAKASSPKWSGPLGLPPEELSRMVSRSGLSYTTGAKAKFGAVLSLPPEELGRMAPRFSSSYTTDAREINASRMLATAGRGGVLSLPPEDLGRIASRFSSSAPGVSATYRAPATAGRGGVLSLPPEELSRLASRSGFGSRASTRKTSAPTTSAKTKLGGVFSLSTSEVLQMASLYSAALNRKSTAPVTSRPDAPIKSSSSGAVAKAKESKTLGLSPEELHQMVWDGLNFTAVAAVTSASIVAVQSPIKSVIVNLSRSGTFVPPYSGGRLGLFKALYAGTSASLSGSAVRTVYVTGAKNSKPVELMGEGIVREEGAMKGRVLSTQMQYVMSVAFGDILVTQIPESLSMLKKVPNLLPKEFKWMTAHNASELMVSGFVPRYASGMINFTSLCLLEERIADSLPIKNEKTKHTLAGAASGATAAIVGYPLTALKDYTLVQATVTSDGRLVNKSTWAVTKEMLEMLRANPEKALRSFASNAAKQMPMRVVMTSAIFAIVAGVGEALGSEPLEPVVSKRFQPQPIAKASSHGIFSGSTARVSDKVASPTKETLPEESPSSGL